MRGSIRAAGVEVDGLLLQRLVRGGHEVIFGLSVDPRLGPMLMFGLGGKYVEVFRDVRFAVPPLSRTDALRVVSGIRGRALLEGVRGEKPVDMEKLADVLLRLAQLIERHPRITELDVNPFLASPDPDAFRAVDVRIRVGER
jgi:acetyltransferase